MTFERDLASKTVVQSEALEWLEKNQLSENQAIVASIPDSAELPGTPFEPWRAWFSLVAERVLLAAPEKTLVIFAQSDVRHQGVWIDKSFLVQEAAKKVGAYLLLHRLVCRLPAGTVTFGRATYTHLLVFSKGLRLSQRYGYSDIIPDGGPRAWVRGLGLHTCEAIVRMVKQETAADTLVALFSGKGLLLEVARRQGLHSIGVDLSKKQCRHAERFDLDKFIEGAAKNPRERNDVDFLPDSHAPEAGGNELSSNRNQRLKP